jgi:hypothetical protein
MHRPGIASIVGDRIILDGTPIEEVPDIHAATLKFVVEKVNNDTVERRRLQKLEHERKVNVNNTVGAPATSRTTSTSTEHKPSTLLTKEDKQDPDRRRIIIRWLGRGSNCSSP